MGTVEANLEAIVVPIVRSNGVDVERMQISARLSKAGKYTSLTVTFAAQSQEQLDNIYRELTAHPSILVAL